MLGEQTLHVGHAGDGAGIEIVGQDDDDVRPRWSPVAGSFAVPSAEGSGSGVPATGIPSTASAREHGRGAPAPGEPTGVAAMGCGSPSGGGTRPGHESASRQAT